MKQNAELKSRVHTKDKELSEVQQQLRQKVNIILKTIQ